MGTYIEAAANIWPNSQNANPLDTIAAIQNIYGKINSFDDDRLQEFIKLLVHSLSEKNNETNTEHSLLEATYRTYYKALDVAGTTDAHFLPNFERIESEVQPYIMYGVLFTDYHKRVEQDLLVKLSSLVVDRIMTSSSRYIFVAFRSVNFLYSRYPSSVVDFSMTKFYFCLQSQPSAIREECFVFFKNWLISQGNAQEVFSLITDHWPWTSKHKYYLISIVLSHYKLESLVDGHEDIERFLQGIRLSLRYKNLFSSGQLVVKALSKQNIKAFDQFIIEIIKTGNNKELVYLNSQWVHHMRNKDDLFIQLGLDQSLEQILSLDYIASDNFRFVITCTMFQKLITKHPQSDAIVDYLRQNCFQFGTDTQLFVYKFIVENILTTSSNNIAEKLNFILDFIREHFVEPCSEYRNTILNKLPTIFDFIAKKLTKAATKSTVTEFFGALKDMFKEGISRSEYQALIFNLKLFELILKCFESSSHKSLMKNSSISLNQKLGKMINDENIWRYHDEYMPIFNLLLHSGEFDDVRELVVKILIQLKPSDSHEEFDRWKELCAAKDIDKCVLSLYYSRLSIHQNCDDIKFIENFYSYCYDKINSNLTELENDSLHGCKQGYHVLGFFNSLNELFKNSTSSEKLSVQSRRNAIELANKALSFVLRQLNVAGNDDLNAPPSFQIIEESLEILVTESSHSSESHSSDRKFLLLSFWMTLKACCELATSIGLLFLKTSEVDDESCTLLKQCLDVHLIILYGCRHKGAIEAAGTSVGKLIKGISSSHSDQSRSYKLLYGCFSVLFGSVHNISTTRRGAGLSILFHNLIKNDAQKHRPLFKHAIKILLRHTTELKSEAESTESDQQHDNFDALVLHYLCVLVRDSELKDSVSEYYDEIMMSAIARINEKEWTIRNAALQLFGALVPKIVGQKQAADVDDSICWEPSDITFTEFRVKLPKTCAHILGSCKEASDHQKSISSVILFLEFLSNIEYLKKEDIDDHFDVILDYRELFWRLLSHEFEKVRKLSSKCLARFHDFRYELPAILFNSIGLVFRIQNENFIHGLVSFFIQSIHKLQSESQYVSCETIEHYFQQFQTTFIASYQCKRFSSYVRSYLIDLFELVRFDFETKEIREILYSYDRTNAVGGSLISSDMKRSTSFGIYILEDKVKEKYVK